MFPIEMPLSRLGNTGGIGFGLISVVSVSGNIYNDGISALAAGIISMTIEVVLAGICHCVKSRLER